MPSRRSPPTFMPCMPSCQPLMTPVSGKLVGWPRFQDESKTFPVEHDTPMYCTETVALGVLTSAPVPTLMSCLTSCAGGGPTGTGTLGAPLGSGSDTGTH